jgi:hypothetical protein
MNGYPLLNEEYSLHLNPEGGWVCGSTDTARPIILPDFVNFNPFNGQIPTLRLIDMQKINTSGVEFLRSCDGSLDYDAIIARLQNHFKVDKDTVIECISGFIEEAIQKNHISMLEKSCKQNIKITGSRNLLIYSLCN